MTARSDGLPRSDAGKPVPPARRTRHVRSARVGIREVRRLRYFGLIAESLKPLAHAAELELGALLSDKPEATAAERAVLEDVARLGLLMRAEFAVYLERGDPGAASRVATLAAQRRASLAAVGMERRAKELDLHGYLEAKAATTE